MSDKQDEKLYKYTFSDEAKRSLTTFFVEIQKQNIPITFENLQDLFHQKNNIKKIIDAFGVAQKSKTKIEAQQILTLNHKKNDTVEIITIFIQLNENGQKISLAELEKLYQKNINLQQFATGWQKLNQTEKDITLNDLKQYNLAAINLNEVADRLMVLKNINKFINIKEILLYGFDLNKLENIIRAIRINKTFNFKISANTLITHMLDGGNPEQVIGAKKMASQAKLDLSFSTAAAIDLAGLSPLDAVKEAIRPKVVDIVPLRAVTHENEEIALEAKISLRVKLDKYLLGTNMDIAKAKVTESIISQAGQYKNFIQVISHLSQISDQCIKHIKADKDFINNSGYELLTISIIDAEKISPKHTPAQKSDDHHH